MEQVLAGLAWLVTGGTVLKILEAALKLIPARTDSPAQFRDALQRELEGQRQAVSRANAERDRTAAERDHWHEQYFVVLTDLASTRNHLEELRERNRELEARRA